MNHKIKSSKFIKSILTLFMLALPVLTGCTGGAVQVEFPANHPANPQAPAAEFIPPHNPFQADMTGVKGKPETESMMKHKMHKENDRPHSDHSMGMEKERGSDSKPTMKPDQGEGNHQHKEHSQ